MTSAMASSSPVVVDASVAVKWFVREQDEAAAIVLLRLGTDYIAPSLILSEVARALQRKERDRFIESSEVDRALVSLHGYFQQIVEVNILLPQAMILARELSHPIYDCIYLALAIARGTRVVTADAKFLDRVLGTPHEGAVVALTSWSPGNG